MSEEQIAEIAAGLTKAQRELLLGSHDHDRLIVNAAVARSLAIHGVIESALTPLGVAVLNRLRDTLQ